MPWNGTGVFIRLFSWVADRAAAINITASRVGTEKIRKMRFFQPRDYIVSSGFGNTLTRDGQGIATANLPMGGFKHTGVADGVARTDYASLGQLEDGVVTWQAAGGVADALTATYAPAIAALSVGTGLGIATGRSRTRSAPAGRSAIRQAVLPSSARSSRNASANDSIAVTTLSRRPSDTP